MVFMMTIYPVTSVTTPAITRRPGAMRPVGVLFVRETPSFFST